MNAPTGTSLYALMKDLFRPYPGRKAASKRGLQATDS